MPVTESQVKRPNLKRLLGLTRTEVEILDHRLSEPSVFPDVLEGMPIPVETSAAYTREDIELCAERMERDEIVDAFRHRYIAIAIIVDALEGSTFFIGIDEEIEAGTVHRAVAYRQRKAAKNLQQKFLLLFNASIPMPPDSVA